MSPVLKNIPSVLHRFLGFKHIAYLQHSSSTGMWFASKQQDEHVLHSHNLNVWFSWGCVIGR